MRFLPEETQQAFDELSQNAKPIHAIVGSLIGAVPAIALYFFFGQMGGVLYIMLAMPPALVGLFARFVGRTYKFKHRLVPGLIGGLVHIIGCLLLQFNPLIYVLTPVAFAIAATLAKVTLEPIHDWALLQDELGKLK